MGIVDLLYIVLLLLGSISIFEFILLQNQKKVLKNTEKTRRVLYETVEKISKTNSEDEIYSIILKTIVALIPNATKGSILLKGDEDNFYFQEVLGYKNELKIFSLKKEETYLYKLNGFQETAIINNPRGFDEKYAGKETIDAFDKIDALEIYCTISAPIYIDDRFIGLINVDSEKKNSFFTEKDLTLMNQIKSELQLALKNAFGQNRLKYLAHYDMLTGIMNRNSLTEAFNHELEVINRTGQTFCFAMLDLDDFKLYNDTYGHNFGDDVLVHFSSILENQIKESDVVARFAGDEFIIIFKNSSLSMSEKMMRALKKAVALDKLEGITIEFSYGICEIRPEYHMNFDKALTLADECMYHQKKGKRTKSSYSYSK